MTEPRIAKIKAEIIANIENLIVKATPIFENLHTIDAVIEANKQIERAYDGGREAIKNTIYNLTDEQRNDLYYFYDLNFEEVFEIPKHAIFNIQNGIQ